VRGSLGELGVWGLWELRVEALRETLLPVLLVLALEKKVHLTTDISKQ
jgi:hypothetical protein